MTPHPRPTKRGITSNTRARQADLENCKLFLFRYRRLCDLLIMLSLDITL